MNQILTDGHQPTTPRNARGGLSPAASPEAPAVQVIRAALAAGVRRLRETAPGAERFAVEGVHQMRTTARRLRSSLRAFRPLLDEHWAQGLKTEVRWLADALGAVRDLDVLLARLHQQAADLEERLGPLFLTLAQRHVAARDALGEALHSERYRQLLERLDEASRHPVVLETASGPSRVVLPPLVASEWQRLRDAGRTLDRDAPDDALHRTRILAKRARYTAEAVAPGLGGKLEKRANRFARRAMRVQDVLGRHQDAVVARAIIEEIAASTAWDGPFNLAAGQLIERQDQEARRARKRFRKAWKKLDRAKVRGWLDT